MMPRRLSAGDQLNREFLEIRHRLIDIAAALDRMDRADGADALRNNPRATELRQATLVLTDDQGDRVERVQIVFSDAYDETWQGA